MTDPKTQNLISEGKKIGADFLILAHDSFEDYGYPIFTMAGLLDWQLDFPLGNGGRYAEVIDLSNKTPL